MKLLCLDLATRSGWSIWAPGEPVRYGSFRLPDGQYHDLGHRLLRYGNWLGQRISDERPQRIYYEAPWVGPQTSQDTVKLLFGLASMTAMLGAKTGVKTVEQNNASVRKHFLGRANTTGRKEIKKRVMAACADIGWAPKNDDEADALALLDFAVHVERLTPEWGVPILGGAA